MKRRKISIVRIQEKNKRAAAEEYDDEQDQLPSPSIKDLPSKMLMDILSRLSVKTIIICRCVCKTWLNLLLHPLFAKHHFARAPTCPLLRNTSNKRISRTLYLVELERDRTCDVGDRSCGYCSCSGCYGDRICNRHVNMKLATKFNFPKVDGAKKMMRKSIGCKFDIVNSCNGLLCLRGRPSCNDPVVIYNPVTGEYITLPTPGKDNFTEKAIVCGLGFSPKANQYKVLRWLYLRRPAVGKRLYIQVAEIHTIGSGEWRRIVCFPYSLSGKSFPTFLNGALHWFCDEYFSNFIVSFDFEDEQFRKIPPPPPYICSFDHEYKQFQPIRPPIRHFHAENSKISMGVLKGSLYLCDASSYDPIDIWIMKDYGVKESWFKEYEIETIDGGDRWPAGLYQPIDFLNNGDLLMYHPKNALISYNGRGLKYFKIREIESKFQAIAHIPSFASLKDMIGDNMEVPIVISRVANIELRRETSEDLFLVEEDTEMMSVSDSSSNYDYE